MSPHQCTKCGEVFPDAAEELLKGCSCGSRFFYYIRQEKADQLKNQTHEAIVELEKADKSQIEKDIREITGLDEKPDEPVILDLESIRVIRPGQFEIDIINLFNKKRPLIYKLEEGKYIIDLASSMKADQKDIDKMIRDPSRIEKEDEKQEVEDEEEETDDTSNATEETDEEMSDDTGEAEESEEEIIEDVIEDTNEEDTEESEEIEEEKKNDSNL